MNSHDIAIEIDKKRYEINKLIDEWAKKKEQEIGASK